MKNRDNYVMGELAKACNVRASTIRFWLEKTDIGKHVGDIKRDSRDHREFTKEQHDKIVEIANLLHVQRYTIEGVVRMLELGEV